jgi:hypothetical protein
MNQSVSELLAEIARLKSKADKVNALRNHGDFTVKSILQGVFDPRVVWMLPEGEVPYKPNPLDDQEGVLKTEARRLYLFVKGGNPNLKQLRREALFIELLERLDRRDAALMVQVKDKKLPPEMKGLTRDIVFEAFPEFVAEK